MVPLSILAPDTGKMREKVVIITVMLSPFSHLPPTLQVHSPCTLLCTPGRLATWMSSVSSLVLWLQRIIYSPSSLPVGLSTESSRCSWEALSSYSLSPGSVHAKSLQSCLTLCNPMDDNPPGSSVHGIL